MNLLSTDSDATQHEVSADRKRRQTDDIGSGVYILLTSLNNYYVRIFHWSTYPHKSDPNDFNADICMLLPNALVWGT